MQWNDLTKKTTAQRESRIVDKTKLKPPFIVNIKK